MLYIMPLQENADLLINYDNDDNDDNNDNNDNNNDDENYKYKYQ